MSILAESAIYLAAAVIAVPLFSRLGFGSVLGYLAAGAAIGPWGLRLVGDVDGILHFSEFGVVLLLFVIGLELQPARLWTMRHGVFGLGGIQVATTAAVIAGAGIVAGLDWRTALTIGLGLSLSSTAFALQMLAEKRQLTARHGRTAFSILLFQDLAAIPMIALVPLLAGGGAVGGRTQLDSILTVVLAVGGVVLGGRFLLQHLFRVMARTGVREIFTASALLVVIGVSLLMQAVGLSMALGAFLAGVLLAESEFRHELEADIEPFKGLLLGLFFIAVGMSVNFGVLLTEPSLVAALVVGLTACKFAILFGTGIASGHDRRSSLYLAAAISQGGEFAFVIFGIAVGAGVFQADLSQLLILVVTLSMAATPFLFLAVDGALRRKTAAPGAATVPPPVIEERRVVIAGFGRFGQIVGRLLRVKKIPFTALESDAAHVGFVAKYGNKIFYGDASRLDLLTAAHVEQASVFVLALDDVETSLRTAETVRRHFPHVRVVARARNREHAYRLMDLGIADIYRETFASSLEAARDTLTLLGLSALDAERASNTFRAHDEKRLADQHAIYRDDARMVAQARAWQKELEEIFEKENETSPTDPAGGRAERSRD